MNTFQRNNFLNLIKAIAEHPKPSEFTMNYYGHSCGTPGCALGTYASRTDLQDTFKLKVYDLFSTAGYRIDYYHHLVEKHFGLTTEEVHKLFSATGCGGAATAEEAHAYLVNFLAEKDLNRIDVCNPTAGQV